MLFTASVAIATQFFSPSFDSPLGFVHLSQTSKWVTTKTHVYVCSCQIPYKSYTYDCVYYIAVIVSTGTFFFSTAQNTCERINFCYAFHVI